MANPAPFPAVTLGLILLASLCARAQSPFYTDTGSPSNPAWSVIVAGLNNNTADPGPVAGSVINVNNAATEVGLYGNRPISVGSQRIHIPCNTSTTNFGNFTRWFQTDGNTQVFRLFVNDQNTASTREGAARSEAFQTEKWRYADGVTYEWTGRYTIARRQQGYAVFQLMNDTNEWALQLNITSSGGLLVNNRRNAPDLTLTNPDGSTKVFDGKGFDVRVIDDGLNYKCWIDGVLVADNFYDRPTGETNFRWGKYMGNEFLTSPSTNSVILVSGAQIRSWPGRLDSATTDRVKANNSQFLNNTASWTGGVLPGIHNRAVWNSTVTATNATTLNSEMTWAGIRITNPGGNVTINGTARLKLESLGIDMSAATRNLTVNCPVEPNVTAPWVIAASRAATFNGTIRGYQGITLSGSGSLILGADNTYTGPTEINGGTLQMGNGGTTGSLDPDSAISVASGATFAVNRSNAVNQGTHFSGAPITGAGRLTKSGAGILTLTAANTFTGTTTISGGTLQLGNGGNTGALNTDSAISVASGATFAVNRSNTVNQGTHFSAAPITGSGGLAKSGSGTLALTAANSYTGGTSISGGILQIGNGGTTGALSPGSAISVASGARFSVNRSNSVTQGADFSSAALTGAGGLSKSGAGLLTLTASNSYGGPTTISGGTLQLGNGGTTGALGTASAISVASGATFTVNRSDTVTQGTHFSGAPITGAGSLAKSGAGRLTLNAANTYSGNTTVNQGILSLGLANTNNQASRVTISENGATLDLAFTGTDTVNELFIGTERMPAGVYKAAGNTGPGTAIPQITGTGTLTVSTGSVPAVAGYDAWKIANGTDQPFDGDHDGDGVPNGVELFLGGNGNTTGFTPLPGVVPSAGTFSITWTKGGGYSGQYGTHFTVETSDSLTGIWTTEPAAPEPNATVTFPTAATVKYTFPSPAGGKKFARLKVTGP